MSVSRVNPNSSVYYTQPPGSDDILHTETVRDIHLFCLSCARPRHKPGGLKAKQQSTAHLRPPAVRGRGQGYTTTARHVRHGTARHEQQAALQAGHGTRRAHPHVPLGEARSQDLQVAHDGAGRFCSQLEPVRPRGRRGHLRQVRRGSEQGRCVRCPHREQGGQKALVHEIEGQSQPRWEPLLYGSTGQCAKPSSDRPRVPVGRGC